MIRSVRIHEFGGPEVLRIEEIEVEEAGEGEVRMRIRAIGINRTEITLRSARSPGSLGTSGAVHYSSGDATAMEIVPPIERSHWQLREAVQLCSMSAAARLPTFLSATSRPRSSSALSSENTLPHLPGMLSERRDNEVLSAWGE